jgi:hypothetical protein
MLTKRSDNELQKDPELPWDSDNAEDEIYLTSWQRPRRVKTKR